MEVDECSIDNIESNSKEIAVKTVNTGVDITQDVEMELSEINVTSTSLGLDPNTVQTVENIVPKTELSSENLVVSIEDDATEGQNNETTDNSTENNNREGDEATAVDGDSPDGVYMDRDELIRSILDDPYASSSGNFVVQCLSSPDNSDHSEFDMSDDKDEFELWSSDSTSPEFSDDPDAVKMETSVGDGEQDTQVTKPPKQIIPPDYWKDIQQEKIHKFEFTGNPHIVAFDLKEEFTPLQCFKLFVNDDVINLLVTETNKFARSKFVRPGYHKDFLTGWIDVTPQEMREFIGLLIFMTSRRFPGIKYYWSGDRDFNNPVAGRVMTETRFKRLLTFWHFGDDKGRDYPKIKNMLSILNDNFRKYREPERTMYVGKATLFLREKYAYQRHLIGIPKRGQRLLRLLDSEIYTYKVVPMPPESCDSRISKTKQAVFDLLHDYLNEGRLVVFHNLFISVNMAQELLKHKTQVVGPMRKKARHTPTDLRKLKVRNNEVKGFQNSEGVSILKWKTWGQTCYGLSTCHGTETIQVEKVNKKDGKTVIKEQSKFLRDFNISDKVFDLAEKFSVTESPLNNETTWYRRLANDLLTGTCVSNAFCLYKELSDEKCKFYKFQDQLWKQMVGFKCPTEVSSEDTTDEEG